ncbi:hypothetical protein LX36DRAFT_739933, partial [Colletotrichum falcatum]
ARPRRSSTFFLFLVSLRFLRFQTYFCHARPPVPRRGRRRRARRGGPSSRRQLRVQPRRRGPVRAAAGRVVRLLRRRPELDRRARLCLRPDRRLPDGADDGGQGPVQRRRPRRVLHLLRVRDHQLPGGRLRGRRPVLRRHRQGEERLRDPARRPGAHLRRRRPVHAGPRRRRRRRLQLPGRRLHQGGRRGRHHDRGGRRGHGHQGVLRRRQLRLLRVRGGHGRLQDAQRLRGRHHVGRQRQVARANQPGLGRIPRTSYV